MSRLNLLSIVIPTYNRPLFILRQVQYWSGYPVRVYILDGSKEGIAQSVYETFSSNIVYMHMPCTIEERLDKSTELIDTPYAMMMADDEFFIPKAVERCIDELEKDEELVSCMGLATQFFYGPGDTIIGKKIYGRLINYKVEQDESLERMIYHMNPYICSSVYSVMRSVAWKNNIRLMTSEKYSCPIVTETQFELSTCYQGKSKVVNELMWLRSSENPPVSTKEWNRKVDYQAWYTEPQYAGERAGLAKNFTSYTKGFGGADICECDVSDCLAQLYEFLVARKKDSMYFVIKRKVADIYSFMASMSPVLIGVIRFVVRRFRFYVLKENTLVQYVELLQKQTDCDVDYDQLYKIIGVVNNFRKSQS